MKKFFKIKPLYDIGFVIAITILIIIALLTFRASRHAEEYDRLVTHTYTIIQKMDSLLINLEESESMQRGLIITGERQYSWVYNSTVKEILIKISELRQLTIDNPSQSIRLDSIELFINRKLAWMNSTIALLDSVGSDAAIQKLKTGTGWSLMHSIRWEVVNAQNEERDLLRERNRFKNVYTQHLYYIFSLGGFLSLLLLTTIFLFLKKEIGIRQKMEQELRIHQNNLNELVLKRTAELNDSRQKWMTTLCSIGDAVIVTDTAACITFINPSAEKFTGWKREDALGKPIKVVFSIIDEHTSSEIENPVEKVLKDGNIALLQNSTLLLTKDGRRIPIDDSGAPIRDEKGRITGVILVFRDITNRKTTEKALRESEERFSRAFHNNPAALSISRLSDGAFMDVNENFLRLFKMEKEEVIGKTSAELQMYSDPQERAAILSVIKEKGKIDNIESTRRTRDGQLITLLSSGEIIKVNGEDHLLFSSVDVTERKKMEEILRQSEQKLKYHFENSPLAVVEWDANYIVKRWSKEAERIFGWKASETIGKDINSLNMIYGEDIPIVEKTMEKLSSGSQLTVVSTNRNYNKQGNVITCTWYNSVLLDSEGKMSSVLSAIEDITEIREAEMNLKRAQEKLNMALESGNIGIWEWDLNSDELIWDTRLENMFGVEHRPIPRKYREFQELINEEDLSHINRALSNTLEKGIPFETVFRIKVKNGESKYINTKALLYRNTSGKPEKMLGVCFDVTGMKRGAEKGLIKLHEELLRSNKELERFAYVASHDLQEPLRMVSSYTQLLQKRYGGRLDKDARDYIKFAVDGANRMQALINGLLTYSRIHSKGKDFSVVQMQQVVKEVLINLSVKIRERKAEIQTTELPVIHADERQMVQLVQNLVVNAIKFSPNPPKILISSKTEEDFFIFSVKDEGIGIAPEYFERIFHLFQRLMPRDEYEGTGLGLAICKRIVERHGGTIWLESEPGKGTTFFFSIPIKLEENFNSKEIAGNIPQNFA